MEQRSYNYCPYCGIKILHINHQQVNYCRNCGKKLKITHVYTRDKVQCVICHQFVWKNRFDTIECSFCGSKYHYKCAANWLNTYNSCPLCQNVFLKPKETILKIGS